MNYSKIISSLVFISLMGFISWHRYMPKFGTGRFPQNIDESLLIVGTAAEFPNFEFIKDDAVVGFDIDLINAVAERLGKKVVLKNMPFLTLIPQAQRGSLHIIASGISPTPEREKEILFSQPYLISDPLVVVSLAANQPVKSLEDLHGKIVIVNEGFTAERFMSKVKGIDLQRLPTIADAFLSLRSGRAYAFVVAENNVKPFFKQYSSDKFSIYTIPNTNEKTAFGISKKYPGLKEQLEKALVELQREGFIEALKKKWDIS